MYITQEECFFLLEQIRWNGIPICPYCGSSKSAVLKGESRYHCNACFTSYSVTVGTLFHQTHVALPKWFRAIQLVRNQASRVSVRQLATEVGVSKNTASYMITRIYKAAAEDPELLNKLLEALKELGY